MADAFEERISKHALATENRIPKTENKKADPVWGHLWIGQNGFVYVKHKRFKENENKDLKQILPHSPYTDNA